MWYRIKVLAMKKNWISKVCHDIYSLRVTEAVEKCGVTDGNRFTKIL